MATDDDAVLTLEDIFKDEDIISLSLGAEEWDLIITLAEIGGAASIKEVRKRSSLDAEALNEVVRSLLEREILAKGMGKVPSDSDDAAPDAEVAQYLEYLSDLNYYQVLQINPDADASGLRRSYFRLMREYHPDRFMKEKNPDTREQLKEIFRILTRAYETLTDADLRRDYDFTIPEFTGAEEREDEQALESLGASGAGPEPLPEQNPELAKSFYESGLEDFQKGDHQAATLNFKLAVALDPNDDSYQASLAKSMRILHANQAKENAAKALYFEEERKYRAAIRLMTRAVDLDPEEPDYKFDLARLVEEYGNDLNAARMHVLLALDRKAGNTDYLLLLAKIQERMDEKSDARRTYNKVLSLDKKNPTAKEAIERLKR